MTKPKYPPIKYPPKLDTNTYRLETEEQNGVTYPTLVTWRRKPSSDDIARFCRENPRVVVRSTPLDKTAHVYQCRMVEKEGDAWVALGAPVSVPVPGAREDAQKREAFLRPGKHKATITGASLVAGGVKLALTTSTGVKTSAHLPGPAALPHVAVFALTPDHQAVMFLLENVPEDTATDAAVDACMERGLRYRYCSRCAGTAVRGVGGSSASRYTFTQADAAALLAKHVEGLNALLVQVRASFPFRDACYYLANDTLHLLTGASHDGTGVSRPERSMANARLNHASGGDW